MTVIVCAEVGGNHNGSLDQAKQLIHAACEVGCDVVKFQKRTPELSIPKHMWDERKSTPWGEMSYLQYREKLEFGRTEYDEIDRYCKDIGIPWFASVWDELALAFLKPYDLPCYKIGSPSFTDYKLVQAVMMTGKPVIASTGMTSLNEINLFIAACRVRDDITLCHCTSIYPCPPEKINLRIIPQLRSMAPSSWMIGYSGHEVESGPSIAAVALGATYIERHFTNDRRQWGTDQQASLDPEGMRWLTRQVRRTELAMGDGVKVVYPEELENAKRLRRDGYGLSIGSMPMSPGIT